MTISACTAADGAVSPQPQAPSDLTLAGRPSTVVDRPAVPTPSRATSTTMPGPDLLGSVTTPTGDPLPGVVVSLAGTAVTTDVSGGFVLSGVAPGSISAHRLGWLPASVEFDGSVPAVSIVLEPRVVRALRVSRSAAADRAVFDRILELADLTTVNAVVFDTKDESGAVLYETDVTEAHSIGAVSPRYDPIELISAAKYHDLYTITRIVAFEDDYRADARSGLKLAGDWVDPTNPESWEYPLDLAVEACGFGFDEVQFDYVRFPSSSTTRVRNPETQQERTAAIAAFLSEARDRLHPLGCAVSAAIFGIVLSARNDQGIGQRPEDLAGIIDAVSPMIYPSHYSDGWMGFESPNDHPGPVVADALDDGAPRFGSATIMRPWLQAFYYNAAQVLAGINEAEARGFGWILWNATGKYDISWLPAADGR